MTEHYFTKEQTSKFVPAKMRMKAAGKELELYTAGGVFSPKKIDNGTRLLIKAARIEKGWKVLDLGCGYGAVGVYIKKLHPDAQVVMSDINTRAVKLALMNLKLYNLDAQVLNSDGFKNKELNSMKFDTILLNPPQTAGKQVCFALIDESKKHLVPGGILQIVARSQKGGKQLSKKMEETFGNVTETEKGSGFRVYVSERTGR